MTADLPVEAEVKTVTEPAPIPEQAYTVVTMKIPKKDERCFFCNWIKWVSPEGNRKQVCTKCGASESLGPVNDPWGDELA